MSTNFLDLANRGRNDRWRYLLSAFVICAAYAASFTIFILWGYRIFNWILAGNVIRYAELYLTILLAILGTLTTLSLFIVIHIHKRGITTLITSENKWSIKKYLGAFFAYLGLFLLMKTVLVLFQLRTFHQAEDLGHFLITGLLFLLVLLLQTGSEELLFRGYLLQAFGKRIKNPYILSLIISVLFTSIHYAPSPSIVRTLSFLFVWSFLLTLITIRSNRLELAMGIHWAHNLCVFWLSTLFKVSGPISLWMYFLPLIPTGIICMVVMINKKKSLPVVEEATQ